ncbi:MAG: hypothetical protein ABUK01_03770 [Leptospirales bacterium]
MYIKRLSILLVIFYFGVSCTSTQNQNKATSNPKIKKAQTQFFDGEKQKREVFRIFASSENYAVKQLSYDGKIEIGADPGGERSFSHDVGKYDLVDLFVTAVFSVEVYADSGKISKIRTIRPAKVSELNKLMAEDITRLRFEFPGKHVEPVKFYIQYGVLLQKKLSEADRRKLLEENAR